MPLKRLAIAAALLVSGANAPFAQTIEPGKEGELANFAPPADGARACFSRIYDAEHLRKHPKQTVTEIQFRIAYYVHEPDAYFPRGQRNYYFRLEAKVKGLGRKLSTGGECGLAEDGRKIFCGVECDGGGVMVSRAARQDQILVDLKATGRLRMTLGCDADEEDALELTPGADDKSFLLAAVPVASCPLYEDW